MRKKHLGALSEKKTNREEGKGEGVASKSFEEEKLEGKKKKKGKLREKANFGK